MTTIKQSDPFASIVGKAEEVDVKSPATPSVTLDVIPDSVTATVERSYSSGKVIRLTFQDEASKAAFAELARAYSTLRPAGRVSVRFLKASDPTVLNVRAAEYKPRVKSDDQEPAAA